MIAKYLQPSSQYESLESGVPGRVFTDTEETTEPTRRKRKDPFFLFRPNEWVLEARRKTCYQHHYTQYYSEIGVLPQCDTRALPGYRSTILVLTHTAHTYAWNGFARKTENPVGKLKKEKTPKRRGTLLEKYRILMNLLKWAWQTSPIH